MYCDVGRQRFRFAFPILSSRDRVRDDLFRRQDISILHQITQELTQIGGRLHQDALGAIAAKVML
jgi:hypothetical protein